MSEICSSSNLKFEENVKSSAYLLNDIFLSRQYLIISESNSKQIKLEITGDVGAPIGNLA